MVYLSLIAHDGKQAELVSYILQNQDQVIEMNLYVTGTAGHHIEMAELNVPLATNPASAYLFMKGLNQK